MNPLLHEIRHNKLLWLLVFVPVLFVAPKSNEIGIRRCSYSPFWPFSR